MVRLFHLAFAISAASLVSCGGGSSDSGSNSTTPYQIKTVTRYTSSAYSAISTLTPTPMGIPANSATGIFSSPYVFNNGSIGLTTTAPAGSLTPIVGYEQVGLSSPEFSRFTTGGSTLWPRARFGLYSTARISNAGTFEVTYFDMPYTAVNTSPIIITSGSFSSSDGRMLGLLANNVRFPWLRCKATGTLNVSGSTKTVTLSYSDCFDSYDSISGIPNGNAIASSGSITLTTSDNSQFTVSGNPVFTFGTSAPLTTFTPTSLRGDFQLGGSGVPSEVVGRVYMSDNSGTYGVFAFGIK